ncbi:ferric reductase-like transmembrane domain-containing protein [Streptomyces sp. PTM05]|uniref:Ferric reductase-like transmembrane domain-containing protein n=1 Tax=Streptantibioticus parmotrematis TaxID=2873249 RepID=A0ABS7QWJ3_9ACTN|nr:ferric reductase-like transmembrane domain-containing protein [Streptantibioticus parmotrematis]
MIASAAGPNVLRYASRAVGTVAFFLLTVTVALGIATAGRCAPQRFARFEISMLHRNLSLLSLLFLICHITTALADSFVRLGWLAAVVPFLSSYRRFWLGLGTVAFDLLLAVLITTAVRLRIGRSRWKAIHWLAYAMWPDALFHAAGIGTDTPLGFQLALYGLCLALVLGAVWWRLLRTTTTRAGVRLCLAAASSAVSCLLVVFVVVGPAQPDWARRAAPISYVHTSGFLRADAAVEAGPEADR